MKVFVTGATGAIGRFAVPALIEAGHEVTGLARTDEKAAQLETQGARAAQVSLFDEAALKDAFDTVDAVCNLATAIPPVTKATRPANWLENERIRREGSTAVVNAALAAGVGRLVQEAITFVYPSRGDQWIDESVELAVPPHFDAAVTAERNAARFTEQGGAGVLLRFGLFYGRGSSHTEQFINAARRHVGAVVGRGSDFQSWIHLEDAAAAVVAALDAPPGVYNVVDDDPLPKREAARALGSALGKRIWISLPGRLARLGGKQADLMMRSQRVSNAAFKSATGWAPAYASVRDGWKAIVDA